MQTDQPTEILSAEARTLREENIRNMRSLREEILSVQESGQRELLQAFLRASQDANVRERRAEIARLEVAESLRRIEAKLQVHDERFDAVARAVRRDHESISSFQAQADEQADEDEPSITPWFLRPVTWRPVLIASVLAVVLSTITACATVRMLAPSNDAPDAARPAPSFTYGSP